MFSLLVKSISLGPTSDKSLGILFTLSPSSVVKKLVFLSASWVVVIGYPLTNPGK